MTETGDERDPVRRAVLAAHERGLAPGAAVQYGDGLEDVDAFASGVTQTHPPNRALEVTVDTIFDVASITKVAATTAVLMRLVANGTIGLDTRLTSLVPEVSDSRAANITIKQLAGHASGFPAHLEFFKRILAGERLGADTPRDALLRMVAATRLSYEPGTEMIYSDLGFILLGVCLERTTGKRLDVLTRELVTEPLGMKHSEFVDLHAEPPAQRPHPVAVTEVCPYRGLVIGEVHDDNAHSAGGICGHAGLFSTVGDLSLLARDLMRAAQNAGESIFDHDVVTTFFRQKSAPNTTRVIGWDTPDPEPGTSNAGDLWSRDGVGHMGFTGCSLWLDPPRGRWAILLTNRVHPSRDKVGIKDVRRAVMDAISRRLNAT